MLEGSVLDYCWWFSFPRTPQSGVSARLYVVRLLSCSCFSGRCSSPSCCSCSPPPLCITWSLLWWVKHIDAGGNVCFIHQVPTRPSNKCCRCFRVFVAAAGGGGVPGSDPPECRLHQHLPSVRHGDAHLQAIQTGRLVSLTLHLHITPFSATFSIFLYRTLVYPQKRDIYTLLAHININQPDF